MASWPNTSRISLDLSGASTTKLSAICLVSSGITSSNCLATPAACISSLAAAIRAGSGSWAASGAGAAATRGTPMRREPHRGALLGPFPFAGPHALGPLVAGGCGRIALDDGDAVRAGDDGDRGDAEKQAVLHHARHAL